ncbi:hypothetical protein [Bifidobacterium choloepi]|uniref:Uncharacterized protein n=1 Tax=Bifidobacterium choloepi TaxID=2614131 RepID=A0A6I5NIQ4_9BIFI|nr:hypothetical protein [Bifidobacterium choloepi]NEG70263.1 hypothetical protein [Bifidobacterium choloepi]
MHYFTPRRCESSNKIMYHDKVQALRAAEDSRIERGTELWVYRCEFCGCWHLTHRDPQLHLQTQSFRGGRKPTSRKKGYKPRQR